jgi:hypothetical protein
MPRPPLNPGASTKAGGPRLLDRGRGAGGKRISIGGLGVEDTTMGAEPRALLGALLRLRTLDGTLEGAVDMETLFLLLRFSGSEEGKYPESLLEEESSAEVGSGVPRWFGWPTK